MILEMSATCSYARVQEKGEVLEGMILGLLGRTGGVLEIR